MAFPSRPDGRLLPGVCLAAALLGVGACGDGGDELFVPIDGEEPVLDSIAVEPLTARLDEVGETQAFAATGFTATGDSLAVDVTWSTEDAGVATIDQEGVATARGPGQTDVLATSGDVTGRAVLSVELTIEP